MASFHNHHATADVHPIHDENIAPTRIAWESESSLVELFVLPNPPLIQNRPSHSYPRWLRRLSVALLTVLSFLTMFDRYITAGVLNTLQTFYGISNTTGGLLQLTYIIFYILCLIAIGLIGDRMQRKLILCVSLVLWILTMIGSSFIPQDKFWLFMVVRSLTGIGGAVINALAPPLFADFFTGNARNWCLVFFFMTLPIGASAGVALGSAFNDSPYWPWSMRLIPVAGIISLVLVVVFMPEPKRGGLEAPVDSSTDDHSMLEDLRHISRVPSFWLATATSIFYNFFVCGQAWWLATLINHSFECTQHSPSVFHGLNYDRRVFPPWEGTLLLSSIVSIQSAAACVAGIAGASLCVKFSECLHDGRWCLRRAKTERAAPFTTGMGALLSVPTGFVYLWLTNREILTALALTSLGSIVSGGVFPLNVDIVLNVTPPQRRTAATALQNMLMSLTGDGPAPFIVGAISDAFQGYSDDPRVKFESLRNALFIAQGVSAFACLFAAATAYFYPSDVVRASREARGHSHAR